MLCYDGIVPIQGAFISTHNPRCLLSNIGIFQDTIFFYIKNNNSEYLNLLQNKSQHFIILNALNLIQSVERPLKSLKLKVINEPISNHARYIEEKLTVLYSITSQNNPGHFLIDDMYGSFALSLFFGLLNKSLHITLFEDCFSIYKDFHNPDILNRCQENYNTLVRGLTGSKLPLYLDKNNSTPTFFTNVLVGINNFSGYGRQDRFTWKLFRQFFLRNIIN